MHSLSSQSRERENVEVPPPSHDPEIGNDDICLYDRAHYVVENIVNGIEGCFVSACLMGLVTLVQSVWLITWGSITACFWGNPSQRVEHQFEESVLAMQDWTHETLFVALKRMFHSIVDCVCCVSEDLDARIWDHQTPFTRPVATDLGEKKKDSSYWILMPTKGVVPNSRNKTFKTLETEPLTPPPYPVPEGVEAALTLLKQYEAKRK